MENFSIPPMPAIDWSPTVTTIVMIGCIIGGALLLWRGFQLSRLALAVLGGVVGWSIGDSVAKMAEQVIVEIPPIAVSAVLAWVGAVFAFLLARFVLALLAGVAAGGATLYCVVHNNMATFPDDVLPAFEPTVAEGAELTAGAWMAELSNYMWSYLTEMLSRLGDGDVLKPMAILAGAFLIPLVLAMVFKKLAISVMTSLVGAAALVGAFGLASMLMNKDADPLAVFGAPMGIVAIVALTAGGLVVQAFGARRHRKALAKAEAAEK
ncbi:MAG: hypothetical protein ACYS8X_04970 [Planctomycetota bacterium]|jgi:hypothetical protein